VKSLFICCLFCEWVASFVRSFVRRKIDLQYKKKESTYFHSFVCVCVLFFSPGSLIFLVRFILFFSSSPRRLCTCVCLYRLDENGGTGGRKVLDVDCRNSSSRRRRGCGWWWGWIERFSRFPVSRTNSAVVLSFSPSFFYPFLLLVSSSRRRCLLVLDWIGFVGLLSSSSSSSSCRR